MGIVISLANQKGGVGKTTSAVNIAASLGALGYKTLLIDLDPQGSATSGVGITKKGLHTSVSDVLNGGGNLLKTLRETEYQNLTVAPANISLAGTEFELFQQENAEYRLKEAILPVKDRFDYILIDCPPSLGMLTVNALAASDGVVIPMQCEFYALEGLTQLLTTVGRIKKRYNPYLVVYGILVTMYNRRLLLSTEVMAQLQQHYRDKLFSQPVSRNVKLSEAPGFGRPVYYHDKASKGAKEYLQIAKELVERAF